MLGCSRIYQVVAMCDFFNKKTCALIVVLVLAFMFASCSAEAMARFNRSMQKFNEDMRKSSCTNNNYNSLNTLYSTSYSNTYGYATAKPVVSSAGYAPPLQSPTSYNSSNVPTSSYSFGRNVTMEQLESQRQLNAHFREINEENLRIRKESFNRMMNSINRDSSIKYVP